MIPGYVVSREGKDPSKPAGLFATGLRLRVVGRGGTLWVVSRSDGTRKVAYEALGNAVSMVLERLRKCSVGEELLFVTKNGPDVVRQAAIRVVDWTPSPEDTNGSPQVDLYVACLNELWKGKWRSAGAQVCKKTAGTNTWSDHAWGEAQDLFASWDVMDEIANWTVATAKELNVSYVILRDRIWKRSTGKWGVYTGIFHNHVHTSFSHENTGTPPCAR